ncbi:MAG: ABC transporter permease [Clostridiales bacterium]|jgi:multidrug/hemolysin transport system permease protein|nr:ABC transporter permease [Clostridiales bacterium]
MNDFQSDLFAVSRLIRRNVGSFLKEPMTVFFSLLSPLIILLLYALFLRGIQVDGIAATLGGTGVSSAKVGALVDCWLVSSLLSISCLTVALNSMLVMVSDKGGGKLKDFLVSPVKPSILTISYFLSFFIITVAIAFILFAVCLVYLAAAGAFFLSLGDALSLIGLIVLSCFSSVTVLMLVMGFFKSSSASGGFSGIFSAMIGFFTGAYMPISTFPLGVQYAANILPGSHSTALFRNILMNGAINRIADGLPDKHFAETFISNIQTTYSFKLNFFGTDMNTGMMYAYLAASVVIFFILNIVAEKYKKKKMSV